MIIRKREKKIVKDEEKLKTKVFEATEKRTKEKKYDKCKEETKYL